MDGAFLLVHSPLLGPSSLSELARRAASRGVHAAAPDLTGSAATEGGRAYAETAAAAAADLPDRVVVIGHSGAGAFLPNIGHLLGDRLAALLFVDAVVPPPSGAHRTPARLGLLLDEQTVDGMLLPWIDWWPEEALGEILPDAADRDLLRADLPRLPRSFYDQDVPVPKGWSDWASAYLRLSSAYHAEFEEAGRRGSPRGSIEGTHLSMHTHPDRVLGAIEPLLGELGL